MAKLIDNLRAKATFALMTMGKKSNVISIPDIPEKWGNFLNSGDKWVRLKFPNSEDVSSCIYRAKKGSIFDLHEHEEMEQIMCVTKGASISVYTETENYEVKFPNGAFFPPHKKHLVRFNDDQDIICIWRPAFKSGGWDGIISDKT